MSGAILNGAFIAKSEIDQLRNREIIGLEQVKDDTELFITFSLKNPLIMRIRIMEEPLTAYNLANIVSALTELYTKFWLMAKGRFVDLLDYTQTRDTRFAQEAGLVVAKITHNSPANLNLSFNFEDAAKALETGIDAVLEAKARKQLAELRVKELEENIKQNRIKVEADFANREQDLELERKKAEADLASQEQINEQQRRMGEVEIASREQALELEKRRTMLELEAKELENDNMILELKKKQLQYVDDVIAIANKLVSIVCPEVDPNLRAIAAKNIMNNLFQLGDSKGLERVLPELPVPQNNNLPSVEPAIQANYTSPNQVQKTEQEWLEEGNRFSDRKQYSEALVAYEQALHLVPDDANLYCQKGYVLGMLKRYEEALEACEQALRLNPDDAWAYSNKGAALNGLKRFQEGLEACEQALDLNLDDAYAYCIKGDTLLALNRKEEAQQAYEKAQELGYSR